MNEGLGWCNRYHPITECRNTNLYASKIKINLNEAVNAACTDQVADTMKIELDNKSSN